MLLGTEPSCPCLSFHPYPPKVHSTLPQISIRSMNKALAVLQTKINQKNANKSHEKREQRIFSCGRLAMECTSRGHYSNPISTFLGNTSTVSFFRTELFPIQGQHNTDGPSSQNNPPPFKPQNKSTKTIVVNKWGEGREETEDAKKTALRFHHCYHSHVKALLIPWLMGGRLEQGVVNVSDGMITALPSK